MARSQNYTPMFTAAALALATASFTWVFAKHAADVRQDSTLHQLEEVAESNALKSANRFTRDDGDEMRELIHELEKRIIKLECQ
jgi:hypothetical protein